MHARANEDRPPYAQVADRLVERATAFGGPVTVANGDEHQFVAEPNFLGVANMTRWQTPGSDGAVRDWIKVDIDCSSATVFSQSSVAVGTTPTTTTTTPGTTPSTEPTPVAAEPGTPTPDPDGVVDRIDRAATATVRAVRQR